MKKFKFFFHFNKIASRIAKEPRFSLHFYGKCHIVKSLIIRVNTVSKINKRQPYAVMVGRANDIKIDDVGAVIN